MSEYIRVKGNIVEKTGGVSRVYAKGGIEHNSNGFIDYFAKNHTYGEPEKYVSVFPRLLYVNGHFYNKDGTFEGKINEPDFEGSVDDVYVCDGKSTQKDKNGDDFVTYNNTKILKENDENIVHSDFQKICNIIKHEGLSFENEEYLYIAHTNYNEAKRTKKTMLQLLNSGYSSVEAKFKVEMKTSVNDTISLYSRAGAIDAILRNTNEKKEDPTNGATQWDGEDFLAWGIDSDLKPDSKTKYGHNKFDEYDYIKINKTLYDTFVEKVTNRRGNTISYNSVHDTTKTENGTHSHKTIKKKDKAIYDLPNADFSKEEYWTTGDFYYSNANKKTFGLEATRVAGYSIFWKKIKI
ncbi:hypothetical protein [Flavobacterium ginsenosidimutans]|uniref:hypothetical protein n=1 Tax=Flavobacterium ginsenosidimutans TaxID=687844 RepID=UPI003D98486A